MTVDPCPLAGGGAESSLAATPESLPGGGPPVDLLLVQFWYWHASSDWAAFLDWAAAAPSAPQDVPDG